VTFLVLAGDDGEFRAGHQLKRVLIKRHVLGFENAHEPRISSTSALPERLVQTWNCKSRKTKVSAADIEYPFQCN